MNFKQWVPTVIVIMLIGGVTWFAVDQKPAQKVTPVESPSEAVTTQAPVYSYTYQGEDGKTALTLLTEKYSYQTQSFSYGELVLSINGLEADDSHYWAFKVNGQDATVGADAYTTKSTDTIEWVYTEL